MRQCHLCILVVAGCLFAPVKSFAPRSVVVSVPKLKSQMSTTTTLSSASLTYSACSAVAVASISAMAKLLSSIGLGSLAARRENVLDKNAISVLSRLTFWVFQPAFLLCSVASTLCMEGGIRKSLLAVMPVASALQIGLGAVVSSLVTKTLHIDENESSDVRISTTFANSGPLPLIFADSLFQGGIRRDVTACISFYLLAWSPLFWTCGRMILGTTAASQEVFATQSTSWKDHISAETSKWLSPPVVGCILGILIGTVPLLRSVFMGGLGTPLFSAVNTLGTAYLPASVLVLAGSLVQSTTFKPGGPNTNVSRKALWSIMASRFLLAPLLSLVMVSTLSSFNLLGSGRSRAILTFVLLMEGCMPPAQNSVIMLQLEGLTERAGRMAKMLALLYSVAVVPVTILMSGCLGLSEILNFT